MQSRILLHLLMYGGGVAVIMAHVWRRGPRVGLRSFELLSAEPPPGPTPESYVLVGALVWLGLNFQQPIWSQSAPAEEDPPGVRLQRSQEGSVGEELTFSPLSMAAPHSYVTSEEH